MIVLVLIISILSKFLKNDNFNGFLRSLIDDILYNRPMSEINTSKNYSRDEVIEEFRIFIANGSLHPDYLFSDTDPTTPNSDPRTVIAMEKFKNWKAQRELEAGRIRTAESSIRCSVDIATIFSDAGFTNKSYLVNTIANGILEREEEDATHNKLIELANEIHQKRLQILEPFGIEPI